MQVKNHIGRKSFLKLAGALALAFLLAGTPVRADKVLDVTDPAVVEAFVDGAVIPSMKLNHSPAGVVVVMKGGKVIFKKGYGFIDVDKRVPVDPDTSMFRPGSISKLFTWVSVMQLVEQGKLDLDKDVNTYLKTFQIADTFPDHPITLRHIMTHTGGFEDGGLGYLIVEEKSSLSPAEAMKKYEPTRISLPGEHVAYSNYATALAGLIIQNVSGLPFDRYVQKNIFDVLSMKYSTFVEPLPSEFKPYTAKSYRYDMGKYTEGKYEILGGFAPAGSAAVSASDMVLFARALMQGGAYDDKRILKSKTLQQMIEGGFTHDPRVRGMGLGFLKRRFGPAGFDNFGHDGATNFFLSHFGMSFQEDLMLFSSFSGPGARAAHTAFVKSFYDEFFPHNVEPVTPPTDFAERGKRFAGTYNNYRNSFTKIEAILRAFSGIEVVPLEDNTMMIGDKRYVEVDKNLFREVDDYGRIVFQEDEKGNVVGFVLDGLGVFQFYKAPFYETSGFNLLILGFAIIVFTGVFLRLAYQWGIYKMLARPEKRAVQASFLVAALNMLFFACIGITILGGLEDLMEGLPLAVKILPVFSSLAVFGAFYHLFRAVQVWRGGLCESVWGRVRFSIVTVAALLMAWFYYYWNFFGFNYFS